MPHHINTRRPWAWGRGLCPAAAQRLGHGPAHQHRAPRPEQVPGVGGRSAPLAHWHLHTSHRKGHIFCKELPLLLIQSFSCLYQDALMNVYFTLRVRIQYYHYIANCFGVGRSELLRLSLSVARTSPILYSTFPHIRHYELSQAHLDLSCPSPGICRFSKESWFPRWGEKCLESRIWALGMLMRTR